jgi:hypothetical protein
LKGTMARLFIEIARRLRPELFIPEMACFPKAWVWVYDGPDKVG